MRGDLGADVGEKLRGGLVVGAAGLEGRLLAAALERDAGQGVVGDAGDVLGQHVGQKAGVGVAARTGKLAHAVRHDAALLARRGHDGAARAHAEAVDATTVLEVAAELVRRHRQRTGVCDGAVLHLVDHVLGVLDAHAHGEHLGLEREALVLELGKDVARGVAACKDGPAAANFLELGGTARRLDDDAQTGKGAVLNDRLAHARVPAHVAAGFADALDERVHHMGQYVASDVGHCLPKDVGRGPRLDERLEDPCMRGGVRARGELAVGEGARASRTELDIALRVKPAGGGELRHVAAALLGWGATLDEDGSHAGLSKAQRREKACRAGAHHDGAGDAAAGLEHGRLIGLLLGDDDVVGRQGGHDAALGGGARTK